MTEPDESTALREQPASVESGVPARGRGGLARLRQAQIGPDAAVASSGEAQSATGTTRLDPSPTSPPPTAPEQDQPAAAAAHSSLLDAGHPSGERPAANASRARTRPSRLLLSLAAVLVLAVAGLTVLNLTSDSKSASASSGLQEQFDRRAAAASAARQFAVNFFTYDYRSLDRDLKRVTDQSSGAFQKDYISKEPQLRKLIPQAKVVATSTVSTAGVSLLAKDQAIVLVTADQLVNSLVAKNGQNRYRLKLTMQQTPTGWLAADVTPVV